MKRALNSIRIYFESLSLTSLLLTYLILAVTLILGLASLVVYLGVDRGFLFRDGILTAKGGLVISYAVVIAASAGIMLLLRRVFIRPMQKIMEAMDELAEGDFTVRLDTDAPEFRSREIREFAQSFNKTAEELSGTEILRKDFINNFSHEFKTPIVSISGFADLLLEVDLPEDERNEYLAIIRDESRRLADLASNILTLNRIESQSILRDKEFFRLDEQIRQSILVTEQKWKDRNLDFQTDLPGIDYLGNPSLMKEVWLNLLDNAAKFSPQGGVVTTTLNRKENSVIVSVTDHGPGMNEKTASHIFEQFYQGDTSHRTQGNGLGLAMVYRIVQLHGGTVSVDTAPGKGSCFTVTLTEKTN